MLLDLLQTNETTLLLTTYCQRKKTDETVFVCLFKKP